MAAAISNVAQTEVIFVFIVFLCFVFGCLSEFTSTTNERARSGQCSAFFHERTDFAEKRLNDPNAEDIASRQPDMFTSVELWQQELKRATIATSLPPQTIRWKTAIT
jgi:hypothetical protein